MAKSENKTKPNALSVEGFLSGIENDQKRNDAYTLVRMMQEITQELPVMWGDSIVGFGTYHYEYASGREGDWFKAGFSPRKQNLTVYLNIGFDKQAELMEKLGKYKTGVGCLYIKRLEDIDLKVLEELISRSVRISHPY